MIRATKQASTEKKACFECRFLHVRTRARREISLTSLSIRVRKHTRLSVVAVLALVGYLVARWFANR